MSGGGRVSVMKWSGSWPILFWWAILNGTEGWKLGKNAMTTASRQEARRGGLTFAETVRRWRFRALAVAFTVLLVCQAFMVVDVLADIFYIDLYIPWMEHSTIELVAVIAMTVSLVVLGWILVDHMRQNRRYREAVRTASGEFLKTIAQKFDEWGLSESEREIALLLIKGLSISEIAQLRNTRPGTIKSQSNAIYRKAGLRGRSELVAYFVEDLLAGEKLLAGRT